MDRIWTPEWRTKSNGALYWQSKTTRHSADAHTRFPDISNSWADCWGMLKERSIGMKLKLSNFFSCHLYKMQRDQIKSEAERILLIVMVGYDGVSEQQNRLQTNKPIEMRQSLRVTGVHKGDINSESGLRLCKVLVLKADMYEKRLIRCSYSRQLKKDKPIEVLAGSPLPFYILR